MAGRRAPSRKPIVALQQPDAAADNPQRTFDVIYQAILDLQARRYLDLFTATEDGYVPASGGDPGDFLCADGTWKAAGGSITVSASPRFLGRITAGAGAVEELTGTQATTLLNTFTSTLKGLAPLSGGGTANFLRADGTWAAPTGTAVAPSGTGLVRVTAGAYDARAELSGDVSTSGALVTAIGANKVTSGMIRQAAALSVLGNATNGMANITDISGPNDGDVLKRSGTALVWSPDLTTLTNQNYWFGDGSDGALAFDGSATVLGMAPASSVYTLTRDIFATTIDISNGVTIKTAGFSVFATGTCTGTGTARIQNEGGAGANGAASGSAAAGAATSGGYLPASIAGGAGGTGTGAGGAGGAGGNSAAMPWGFTAGTVATTTTTGNSGTVGQGGAGGGDGTTGGGASGTGTVAAATTGPYPQRSLEMGMRGKGVTFVLMTLGTGGGGGRGGASCGGGGGGASGGWLVVMCKQFAGSLTLSANGGAGGNSHTSGNGGGGAGGSGGVVVAGYQQGSAPTVVASGGAGGAGHGAGGSGGSGGAGLILLWH